MKLKDVLLILIFAVIFAIPPIFLVKMDDISFEGLIFSIIMDLILWGIVIVFIVKKIKHKIIENKGKEYTANFISYASGIIVNNVPMYYICYAWKNEYGEIMEGRSSSNYTIQEARMFEMAKNFKIKVLQKGSIITTKPAQLINHKTKDNNLILCKYCNSIYNVEANKCPNCGASKKND